MGRRHAIQGASFIRVLRLPNLLLTRRKPAAGRSRARAVVWLRALAVRGPERSGCSGQQRGEPRTCIDEISETVDRCADAKGCPADSNPGRCSICGSREFGPRHGVSHRCAPCSIPEGPQSGRGHADSFDLVQLVRGEFDGRAREILPHVFGVGGACEG